MAMAILLEPRWCAFGDGTDDINCYALFLGYLAKAVRGLGFLVVTWTTVVLLGGFVSVLGEKDFWCLTVIILVQTLRVFDFLFKEKAIEIFYSLMGLLSDVFAAVVTAFKKEKSTSVTSKVEDEDPSVARIVLIIIFSVVQLLVLTIVMCPLAVLYLLGLYIYTGISLWRLIEHDYGNTDGAANLQPGLNVLYSLAVAQGVVFGYKIMCNFLVRTGLAEIVAADYSLDRDIVADYLDQTVMGCMKDPSFAKKRNLITYAVNLLMEPRPSPSHDYLCGVQTLGTILQLNTSGRELELMKQLMTESASFSHVFQRLLNTMLCPGNSIEIRKHTARIVVHVADRIHLEQLTGWIQLISALLNSFKEYCWRYGTRLWQAEEGTYQIYKPRSLEATRGTPENDCNRLLHEYKEMVVLGLRIFQKLAIYGDNCRVIINTEGLPSKIMAPLISKQNHMDNHDEWFGMAKESVELIRRLVAAPGETGRKLQYEIASNMNAGIGSLKSILECPKCEVWLKRQAVKVILDLSVDTSSIMANGGSRRTMFSWILLHIFLLADDDWSGKMYASMHWVNRSSHIRGLAGENLLAMLSSRSEESSMSMQEAVRVVATSLTRTIVKAENSNYRLQALQILEHLCRHYTQHDEFVTEVAKAAIHVMPEVLKQILVYGRTGEERQAVTGANKAWLSAPGSDLENGGVSQGNVLENASSSQQQNCDEQHVGSKLRKVSISLCIKVYNKWISSDQHLTRQFDIVIAKICSEQRVAVETFASLIQKLRQEN